MSHKTQFTRSSVSLPRQRGAALIVSLIVLLVVTLLALGTMESAVMQERMASNSQNKNVSFQLTESLLEDALRDTNVLASSALHSAITRGVGDGGSAQSYQSTSVVASEYKIIYRGEGDPFARPGRERSFSNDIPSQVFELEMSTSNSNTQANSTHTIGFTPN